MSIYNTLRALPTNVASMLMARGFMKDLTPEERERMDGELNALVEEWFGPAASGAEDKKKEKKTKTKAAVVSGTPSVMDRAHLETLTVSELKELGKDCAAIKGRKPRAELIELVLQHLSGSSTVAPVTAPVASPVAAAAEEASDGSDEELREETPPPTEDKAKKAKATKEKKEKAPKEKKEKAKPAKKEKAPKVKEESKAAEESPVEESDDENTVELKEWFHPSEMSKPKEERQRYFIDQKTNELFHPDRLQDGEAEWRWDDESGEIVPIG